MSIKLKLTLSYIAMIFIPIFLSAIAIMLIIYINVSRIEKTYNIKSPQKIFIKEPFALVGDASNKILSEIKLNALKNPEALENAEFLQEINTSVNRFKAFIIVRKNDEIIYSGKKIDIKSITNELPKFAVYTDKRNGNFLIGKGPLFVKQQDFYFRDNSEGSIFLLTDGSVIFSTMKSIVIQSIIFVILIFIVTNGILSSWMSRTILIPLKELKSSAEKIKEGDLDFKVNILSKDEIGEVCEAFEEMRCKLKESLDTQIQYEENRKELISNISHDLKTPITSIKGYVEGIKDGVPDTKEKMNKYISTIYNKTCDMDVLIDELFLYSKLDLNKIPFNFEIINIKDYLLDCIEELKFDMEKENVKLLFQWKGNEQLKVIGDREKLKRVITNIINNSVKYIGDNGIIIVNIRDLGKFVEVGITDNGKGISESDLPLIFKRFYRADSSRNSLKGGSGLGLAIAKRIIEEHGGDIWADSKEGIGTTVYFSLKKS